MLLKHWEMLIGRWYGPLSFRLFIRPAVAAILAIRAGLADARAGRPPYGWTIVTHARRRWDLIQDGWRDIAKLFFAALMIDILYQIIVFHWLHPAQSVLVAATLALPAYFFLRGPANRIARLAFKYRRRAEP